MQPHINDVPQSKEPETSMVKHLRALIQVPFPPSKLQKEGLEMIIASRLMLRSMLYSACIVHGSDPSCAG